MAATVIAILGTGKMGEALLSGLLRAGRPPSAVVAAVRREDRAAELRERYGVQVADAAAAAKMADTLVLAVKPQDMGRLLDEIAPVVPAGTLVISVAAGHHHGVHLPAAARASVPVVRVMSNTPVLVDEAMSVISAGAHAGEEHLRRAEELLRPVGKVLRIPESQQDAATALSGSGPAYVYLPGRGDGGRRASCSAWRAAPRWRWSSRRSTARRPCSASPASTR